MRHFFACLGICIGAAAFAASGASAQATLLRGYGGPAGFGTNVLPGNDDGLTSALDLTGAFPGGLRFFGGPYSTFWVNNNGNITFSGPVFNYTPMRFPIAARPMIAPFWGDVDTRGSSGPDNLVYWSLEPGRLVVTWYDVGYFAVHTDKRMSFQMIITNTLDCGSGDFDVEYRYNRCEWTTGDASGGTGGFGGTPAQAGFDAGNLMDYVELPGSFSMDILDLCTTSNIGDPGVWQFSVRGGVVGCADAGMPCEVPDAVGPCAVGRTQCVGSAIECQAIGVSSPERCDLVDNDCNGEPDDGDDLCPGIEVCELGHCVPPCFEGGCEEGDACNPAGVCVEAACADVTCPAGQRCVGGECVEACEGIVCPHGQQCVEGRCTDLCAVVTCEPGEVCRDGICQPSCPCLPCPAGESCAFDGTCTQRNCDIVICDVGFYCDDGVCYDACEGVVCPEGQECVLGECLDIPPPMPDAGMPPADGGTPGDGGAVEDGGVEMGEDAGVTPPGGGDDGGCGCRVTERGAPSRWAWLLLGLAGVVIVRRRRGRRS